MKHFPPSRIYGPIKELLSEDNPPKYKDVLASDYAKNFFAKGLDGEPKLNNFKLWWYITLANEI